MKMNSAQIERTLGQLDAKAIPAEHPAMQQLERLFGEHTYFLDSNGLNIVEPIEPESGASKRGVVVNIANWTDAKAQKDLQPHEPEATDLVVDLESDRRH
jgi:hypothetical protein